MAGPISPLREPSPLLMKPRIFSQVFWKKYNFMHFERRNAFQNA